MIIYFIMFVLWLLLYVCLRNNTYAYFKAGQEYEIVPSKERKRIVIALGVVLFLIMGLRAENVGTDTMSYAEEYYQLKDVSLADLFTQKGLELGYRLLTLVLFKLRVPWQGVAMVISAFVTVVFSRFIYKYCANVFLGFYLFGTVDLFFMSMTGLRQIIAVAIVLLAFEVARKQRLVCFLSLMSVAVLFHYSALVCLPIYFLFKLKYKKKSQLLIGLMIPLATRLASSIFYYLMTIFATSRYKNNGYLSTESSVSIVLELESIMILIICYICLMIRKDKISDREYHFFFLTSAYLSCIELGHAIDIATRLSFYFALFMTTLMVNVVYGIKDRKIRYLGIIMLMAVYMLRFILVVPESSYGIGKYMFFWT